MQSLADEPKHSLTYCMACLTSLNMGSTCWPPSRCLKSVCFVILTGFCHTLSPSLSLSVCAKADVYAFGIILWEILTREEPYEEKEPMQIVVEVVNEGLRPTIRPELLDAPLVPLMRDCWHTEPSSRPTFEKIVERLRAIKDSIPEDDNSEYGIQGTSRTNEYRRKDREEEKDAAI